MHTPGSQRHCCALQRCAAGLQIFLDNKPDVVILEVGIGGRIDATNILKAPAVTGGMCLQPTPQYASGLPKLQAVNPPACGLAAMGHLGRL